MPRYWTSHWQNRYWNDDVNSEGARIASSGSNKYRQRGVTPGDRVYIVSLIAGHLYLGGRMTVGRIVTRAEAVEIRNSDNLFDATDWIIAEENSGTLSGFHRRLSPEFSRRLRFIPPRSEPKGLFFVSETDLDVQATRGVRELTAESAALLDDIIAITDRRPREVGLLTITTKMLIGDRAPLVPRPAEDIPNTADSPTFTEGEEIQYWASRYERDPLARAACVEHYGTRCVLCGFDFVAVYGEVMEGFLHVHHIELLSGQGESHVIDPIEISAPFVRTATR